MPEGGVEAAIGDGPRALRDKGVSAPANGCRKEPQRGAVGAPVIAKHVNSRDRKGDVAVAPPFAVDVKEHAAAIDVGELKPCSFEKAQPADIDGGQTRPGDGQPDAVEEDPDFLTAENDGEFRLTRRSDEVEQLPLSADGVREEELD